MTAQQTVFTIEDLINSVHAERDTAYPEELSLDALSETLRGILATLLQGNASKAAAGLAVLIDTVDNVGLSNQKNLQ